MEIPSVLVWAAIVCSISLVTGLADDSKQFSSSSSSVHAANGYFVSTSQSNDNGHCIEHLTIKGPQIYKVTSYECRKESPTLINLNTTLLVGNFYSERPAALVEIVDNKCLQEEFFQRDGKWASTANYLDALQCEKVKVKIEGLKELYQRWLNYYKEQQDKTQLQLQQLQINLQMLQQNLFGGIFGLQG